MIIDLQRRLREIGRIRIGQQVPIPGETKTGRPRTRPVKLECFRLTSKDMRVIGAAARLYGGDPHPWDSQPGQHELFTTVDQLPIMVPPGGVALSQFYEQWSGGGCRARCDGAWETIGDQECVCDPAARACQIHTRLSVVLADLPGLGVWRLDTQGWYAATELGSVVPMLEAAAERGRFLPARLRLEQREVKRVVNGKPETRKFAVPVIDLDVSIASVPGLVSGARFQLTDVSTGEIGPADTPSDTPADTPVDAPTASAVVPAAGTTGGLVPVPGVLQGATVADQVKDADTPRTRTRKSTPKLPDPPARTPKKADVPLDDDPPYRPTATPVAADPSRNFPTTNPPAADRAKMGPDQFVAMRGQQLGLDHHLFVAAVTGGRDTSAKKLTVAEQPRVVQAMEDVSAGRSVLDMNDQGVLLVRPVDTDMDRPVTEEERKVVGEALAQLAEHEKRGLGMKLKGIVPAWTGPRFSLAHSLIVFANVDRAINARDTATPVDADGDPF